MGLSFDCKFRYRGSTFDLDFAFEASAGVTALMGPSGSGKTTVVKLIAGLLSPSMGRIELGGLVLVDTGSGIDLSPESRRIGLVLQDSLLFPHMTVRENLLFATSRGERGRGASAPSWEEVTRMLDIEDSLDRPSFAVSGGQARRIALGRALLRDPALLVLDEPLTGLDAALRETIVADLAKLRERWPVPTLIVTHDPASIEPLGAAPVFIGSGRAVQQGYSRQPSIDAT